MLCHITQGCQGLELFHILLLYPDPDPCWLNAMTELCCARQISFRKKKSRTVNCQSTLSSKVIWLVCIVCNQRTISLQTYVFVSLLGFSSVCTNWTPIQQNIYTWREVRFIDRFSRLLHPITCVPFALQLISISKYHSHNWQSIYSMFTEMMSINGILHNKRRIETFWFITARVRSTNICTGW